MAFEPGAFREFSPTNSGRASPVSRKWRGEEEPHAKDKAFRRYASGVERSLSLFDTNLQEWADYISFLGRLLKSLQAHPSNIAVIPSKRLVARRLAQCLNPTLPSGVHQKALEVYNYLFSTIGTEALSRDLSLYLPGLSPVLSFASLTVRSPFLALLETHLLKLDPIALRPAFKAIILALLPGLEEETSEDFEQTLKLLDGFREALHGEGADDSRTKSADEYFWQCFFLASITGNSRRLGALAYLTRHLPKLGRPLIQATPNLHHDVDARSEEVSEIVTSPEPGLLIRCFAAGLGDDQILIQRGFLDLLVTHLPLHAKVFQKRVKPDDLELLMTAAAGVVARRDMSLNRRLWSWLLGPDPVAGGDGDEGPESPSTLSASGADPIKSAISRTTYFEDCGLKPLTKAILKMIAQEKLAPAERAKPFRICLSLMDRWEIGGIVVPEIFLPLIRSVKSYQKQASKKADFNEVLRSASVFFDGVESGVIWSEIMVLITEAIGSAKSTVDERLDNLSLVRFMLGHFNVREEEMLVVHAPLSCLALLAMLGDTSLKVVDSKISTLAIDVAIDLIDLIPARAYITRPSTQSSISQEVHSHDWSIDSRDIVGKVRRFYVQDQGDLTISPPPFTAQNTCELLLREAGRATSQSLDGTRSSAEIAIRTRLLVSLLSSTPKVDSLDSEGLLDAIRNQLLSSPHLPFSSFTSTISVVTALYPRYISHEQFLTLLDPLVGVAWSYLSPSDPKYHVEAVRSLWQLQTCLSTSNHEIEAALCRLIVQYETSKRDADNGRRFSILWTHTLQDNTSYDRRGSKTTNGEAGPLTPASIARDYEAMLCRPLFLLLDSLLDEKTQLSATTKIWLQHIAGGDKLFRLFVNKFAGVGFLRAAELLSKEKSNKLVFELYSIDDDVDQCLYYLQKLCHVFRWSSSNVWAILANSTVSTAKSSDALYLITGHDGEMSLQEFFVHVCLCAIERGYDPKEQQLGIQISQLYREALLVLQQLLSNPFSSHLSGLRLENRLIERLELSLLDPDPFIQVSLLDVVLSSLRLKGIDFSSPSSSPKSERRISQDPIQNSALALATSDNPATGQPQAPPTLLRCLQAAFGSPNSQPVLESWIFFLSECLPLFSETIFQVLIPLVETFCSQVAQTFESLRKTFKDSNPYSEEQSTPESTLISLLNGLELVLARGHDRLRRDEAKVPTIKSPDQPQGFFGNMVSGVFSSDTPQSRTQTANNRLTVLLTFQDAVNICFKIWSWGGKGRDDFTPDVDSIASFNYTSLRMRNRARRLLEHLFQAEALECLETVIGIWQRATVVNNNPNYTAVFNLLHVLDGSRPKNTIPAIFDAIYSRTNPSALDPTRKSTLTTSLQDTELVIFLVDYTKSLEDDAMDEIWTDCMTFLKDILANPFPHRQILPGLLEFASILGEKVDNTNFGEQRRMRKDLGDLFLRLLTATFTVKPIGFETSEKSSDTDDQSPSRTSRSDDIIGILATIAPNLPKILVEPDRVLAAANIISTSVIGPTFRSKSYPENISTNLLGLLYQITRLPNTQKIWKKDLSDAFNDPRFFASALPLFDSHWQSLLRQWVLSDKDRMLDLLSRLAPPTTAGIVFGVGATSARLEADRKTQLNLRRIAAVILAVPDDTFVTDLKEIEEKIVELLSATTTSSPSSTTRAEIYLVLRALILKTSPIHLAFLWPTINAELLTAISSVIAPDHSLSADTYNNFSLLQACKLLDTLLCLAPDDFQLHEWLFITDTIDAVYRPVNFTPVGLIDELSEELGSTAISSTTYMDTSGPGNADKSKRRPILGPGGIDCSGVNLERKDELVAKVLRPFFSQLSIFEFETTYEMGATDWEGCRKRVVEDLFDERGVVKAL